MPLIPARVEPVEGPRAGHTRRHKLAALAIAALATGISSACGTEAAGAPVPLPHSSALALPATITQPIDGDTVELRFGGAAPERVRLLGIDTPETVHPNKPVECWGPEASKRLAELLPEGTEVLVQRDTEVRDRYGRLLVYLWRRSDGLFINGTMVAEGHARTLSISPNTAHRVDLSATAAQARAQGLGLWGACPAEDTG